MGELMAEESTSQDSPPAEPSKVALCKLGQHDNIAVRFILIRKHVADQICGLRVSFGPRFYGRLNFVPLHLNHTIYLRLICLPPGVGSCL